MSTTRVVEFDSEPCGDTYRQLLDFAALEGGKASLVVRPGLGLGAAGNELLESLKPQVVRRTMASSWPGTELIGDLAEVILFKLTKASASLLKESTTSLFQWVQPELPEDLCLLSREERPWLISVSHENDAYLDVAEDTLRRLTHNIPSLRLRPPARGHQ